LFPLDHSILGSKEYPYARRIDTKKVAIIPAVNPTLYRLYPRWKERKYEESGGSKKPRKVDVIKARIRLKKDGSASLKII